MINIMKRFLTSLTLLLIPFLSNSQCKVVINEIFYSPSADGGNNMNSDNTVDTPAEWVELYNPSACNEVDISCWVLGSNEGFGGLYDNRGIFVFPQGTTIPPLGFIVVGGTNAATKDFDCNTSNFYCGSQRWFLNNQNGWIGLFKNTGEVVNAVYWSTAGKNALTNADEFAHALSEDQYSCLCSGSTLNSKAARDIPGIEFAGSSTGALGEGWKRTTDGGTTWQTETPNQSTPKACNGVCAEQLKVTTSVQNPVNCNDKGSASVTAVGGNPPYTYQWSNGTSGTSISNLAPGSYTCTVMDACSCSVVKTVNITPVNVVFNVTVSAVDPKCYGGTGSVTAVADPAGTYEYTWNTTPPQKTATVTGLPPGDYTVDVTQNGCTISKTVTIKQPEKLVATVTSVDEKCGLKNGSATIKAPGGTSYSWDTNPVQNSQTAVNLPAGTYTGTVEDINGCKATATVTIKNITTITAEISGTPALCKSATGTATVKPTGGELPYGYLWNTTPQQNEATAKNLTPGKYSCEITDKAGCKLTMDIQISAIAKDLTATSKSTNAICKANNGTAEITPTSGVAPYNYVWSTNETTQKIKNLAPGNYWVQFIDDNGCIGKYDVQVGNKIDSLKITPTVTHETCTNKNGKITCVVTGGTLPYKYSWNNINTPTPDLVNISEGDYTLVATDTFGCVGKSSSHVRNIIRIEVESTIVSDHCDQGVGSITLTPTSGKAPYTYLWNTNDTTRTLDSLKSGVYTATVKDALGCLNISKYSIENIKDYFNGVVLGDRHLEQDEESVISADLPPDWKLLYWVGIDGDTLTTKTIKLKIPYPRWGDFTIQLAVISAYGCMEIVTYPVYVEPSWTFYIPNCITLNNDYSNDTFFPEFTGISEMQGWVFNRWGEKIYTFSSMYDNWDGTYAGEKVKQDVYVYKFSFKDLKGNKHEKIGSVTVLRTR